MSATSGITPFTVFVSIIAAFGGLLFGYNTSVISGALLFISEQYHLTTLQEELVVSTILIGALIGAMIGGTLTDKFGRKRTIFMTVLLFFIGTFFLIFANSFWNFITGRFLLGLAIGVVSVASPLYIAEMSPPKRRGALVSFNQLAITIGILFAYIVDYGYSINGEWRWMFGFALVPTILLFLGLFLIPETPSWLSTHGKLAKAKKVMDRIKPNRGEEEANLEGKKSEESKGRISDVFSKAMRPAFATGIGISIFQQIVGINVVIYYAPKIFQLAGFVSNRSAIFATIGIGVINVIMTVVSLWLIDLLGRKPLLLIGLVGMTFSLLFLGFAFHVETQELGMSAVISLMCYVAFFAISLGLVTWVIISEIFPLKIRGVAMGIAVFASWTANYIVSLTFLNLLNDLGSAGTFWMYAGICILGIFFVVWKVPETRNKSFEEIQNFWLKKSSK